MFSLTQTVSKGKSQNYSIENCVDVIRKTMYMHYI